jgi:hypothetical protein
MDVISNIHPMYNPRQTIFILISRVLLSGQFGI